MKKLLALSLALVLALSPAACDSGNGGNNSGGNNTPSVSPSVSPSNSPESDPSNTSDGGGIDGYGQSYIDSHLGSNYSLTFRYDKIESNKTATSTQTFIVTEEGYYQHSEGVNFAGEDTFIERWYIKNANGDYDQYYRISAGGIREGSKATFDDLLGLGGTFSDVLSYMSAYAGSNMARFFTEAGSETFAGRNCDKYIYNNTYEYLIDKETGVCLKYSADVLGTTIEYEATEFKVGGASLPAYS